MCKTCMRPTYGVSEGQPWGRKHAISDYDSPLDVASYKTLNRPPSATQVRRSELNRSTSLPNICDCESPNELDECAASSTNKLESISEHHVTTCDAATITEVHRTESVSEVELISLVGEQIPRYRLRADTITDFTGYDNRDFNAVAAHDELPDLSPELIEETLKYFILCAERTAQMNRTYNDIDAVTSLLQEKESDLELAARIGQGLLEKNKQLEAKNEQLEEELHSAREKISQLRHELNLKDALLHNFTDDEDFFTESSHDVGMDTLQKQLSKLQVENRELKDRVDSVSEQTIELEEREMSLVGDWLQQLETANKTVEHLEADLKVKADICAAKMEENTNLMGKLIALENSLKKQVSENEELLKQRKEMQVTQMQLTREIADLEDKQNECLALLHEKVEEIKTLRKKTQPSVLHQHYGMSPFYRPEGCLAAELEKSTTDESSIEDIESRMRQLSGVMETVGVVRRTMERSTSYPSSVSMLSEDGLSETDSSSRHCDLGKPGIPGSNDLETALHQLVVLKSEDTENANFLKCHESDKTPTPCPTPDSLMSTDSQLYSKLQIVKPLEGSMTLARWQKLAQPRIEGIFDWCPGVQSRDLVPAPEDEIYMLSDYEEDGMSCDSRKLRRRRLYSLVDNPEPSRQRLNSLGDSCESLQESPRAEAKKRPMCLIM